VRELSLGNDHKANPLYTHMTELQRQIKTKFSEFPLEFDVPMSQKTYFKLGGPAEVYVELAQKEQIASLINWCQENHYQYHFLGGGSNIIVADQGIAGIVIKIINQSIELEKKSNYALIRVGAGMKTALCVRKTIDEGYGGLEYFLGVPGTIGGAIYNNAHYLEDLIGAHVNRVEVLTEKGDFTWLDKETCEFAYDSSRFQRTKEIIYQVEFLLEQGDKNESMAMVKKATEYRAQTQPLGLPSSGCIFQNVPNSQTLKELFPQFKERTHVPGGFLIDQAGLKGAHEGDIEVSEKHAAFFVNKGNGTADQVQKLITRVKQKVAEKFNVSLQEEVFWLK